jgi:DNA-binding response OmpR family regulator
MKNILIIEEDQKIATALVLRLKSAGYEATATYDGLTGLDAAVKNPPHLVLLDICLPVGNSSTLFERIQTLLPTATPVIFVTANKQAGFRQKAIELGAAGYFEKPYEVEELLAAIQNALNPSVH